MGNIMQDNEEDLSKLYESLNPTKKGLNPLLNGGKIRNKQEKATVPSGPPQLSSISKRSDSAKGVRIRNSATKSNAI